ncbi:hypothetical protein NDU88_003912 [Pleurodeles waltl]|uniref:Uncharacterized protein n=1 Tax=Pleurodeles waltl TaxID=8319 RepID=A0AAV7UHK2_PLEWA|nr:hypothetical protein NDU88_003912 [Pleurodeles waltl]
MELKACCYTSLEEYALQRLQGRHYEQEEKAEHLLAAQLRQQETSLAMPAIRAPDGMILTHPPYIAGAFGHFYQTLYAPESGENHN